jgi:hypothetical protein
VRLLLLSLASFAAAAALAPADVAVCRHPARGPARAVSLDAVARSHADAAGVFARWSEQAAAGIPRGGFDSALPACATRSRRALPFRVPPELVGKSAAFAPEGRFPAADLRIATRAGSLADLDADGLADPDLLAKFGVRCWPTLIRGISEVEIELLEGD